MALLLGCSKISLLEIERGGQMGKSTYAMGGGGCSKRTSAYDEGKGGSNFCHFGA